MAESGLMNGWRSYRFDRMASMINDRIDPQEAGVDRYVGLQHLDPDSLRVRRWGSPSDVTGTKLLFRSGDIIFGRRRVYQRKLAVADFDGICSAHAMVLRAKPDVVLPEFLPFFMQSDMFMERAKKISVGSLSPTVNWKSLAQEEFALPPRDEQLRISECLSNLELARDAFKNAALEAETLRKRLCLDLQCRYAGSRSLPLRSLVSLSTAGLWGWEPGISEVDVTVIRSTDLDMNGNIDATGGATRSIPAGKLDTLRLRPGDVVLEKSGGGPNQPVGRVGFVFDDFRMDRPVICGNFMQLLRPNQAWADPEWIFWLLHGMHSAGASLQYQTQTTGIRNLQLRHYLAQDVPVPPLEEQRRLAATIRSVETARVSALERVASLDSFKRAFLNGVLSGEDRYELQ